MKSIIILIIAILFNIQLYGQTTRLVPSEFTSIQNALNVSKDGDIILVSPGIYYENIIWIPEMNGVELRSIDGPATTIIDANFSGRPMTFEGDYIFIPDNISIDNSSILDGFTFRNGVVNEEDWTDGGGVFIERSNPTIKNLIVENNSITTEKGWAHGGGISCNRSESLIENCIIRNNTVVSLDGWAFGGGLYSYDSNITMKNCTLTNNIVQSDKWAYGGGLYFSSSNIIASDCMIERNSVNGGGWSYGGGIYLSGVFTNVVSQFNRCRVSDNKTLGSGPYGTAIYARDDELNFELSNCIINNNGEGITTIDVDQASTKITNSTIINNQSGIFSFGASIDIINTILWNNVYSIVSEDIGPFTTTVTVDHSLIEGGWEGPENMDTNPLLISDNILIPTRKSPCLNAGNIDVQLMTDIRGNTRPLPIGSAPDIGAYEIDQNFAYVLSQFYYDENENGMQDIDEEFIGRGAVKVEDEATENSNSNGIFTLVEPGQIQIEYHNDNTGDWVQTSDPSAYTFDIMEEEFIDTIFFGIYPNRFLKDLVTGIYCPALRCSRTIIIDFFVKNEGTTRESGVLWAELDPLASEIEPLITPDYIENDKMGWIFENLLPGESFVRKVSFKVPGVLEVEEGQLLKFTSEATILSDEDFLATYCYEDDVRCAYDPNDKLINPNRDDALILKNQPITYTIRFQNVGNDYADDVIVRDTLDPDLDYSTFKLLTTSHPDILLHTLSENGILSFNFPQIYLPDSTTDATGSNGYIMYSIQPDSTLTDYTLIENTAHIYFDFNPAIVTNTTSNSVVEMFPISATYDTYESSLLIHPNPSTGLYSLPSNFELIQVLDNQGRLIKYISNTNVFELSGEIDGVYFIKAVKDSKSYMGKVILLRN